MTNLAIDPFNNYRGNRRSNAVREAAIFTSSLQKTINLKSGQSSNFSLILPFEWWSRPKTYCVKSPVLAVLVCLFQDFKTLEANDRKTVRKLSTYLIN